MRGFKTLAAVLIVGLMLSMASVYTNMWRPVYIDYFLCGGAPAPNTHLK